MNDVNQVIPMKFEKSLIYMPIWKHTRCDIDNLICIIIILVHTWYPDSIINKLGGEVVLIYFY